MIYLLFKHIIYIHIYVHQPQCILSISYLSAQGAIGKLSSKLHKNENNSDISLCQIYLLKLQENILK